MDTARSVPVALCERRAAVSGTVSSNTSIPISSISGRGSSKSSGSSSSVMVDAGIWISLAWPAEKVRPVSVSSWESIVFSEVVSKGSWIDSCSAPACPVKQSMQAIHRIQAKILFFTCVFIKISLPCFPKSLRYKVKWYIGISSLK